MKDKELKDKSEDTPVSAEKDDANVYDDEAATVAVGRLYSEASEELNEATSGKKEIAAAGNIEFTTENLKFVPEKGGGHEKSSDKERLKKKERDALLKTTKDPSYVRNPRNNPAVKKDGEKNLPRTRNSEFFESEASTSSGVARSTAGRKRSDDGLTMQFSDFKIVIVIITIIVLLIFVFLVYRNNSLAKQLEEAQLEGSKLTSDEQEHYQQLKIDYDNLVRNYDDSQAEINRLRSENDDLNALVVNSSGNSNPPSGTTSTAPPASTTAPTQRPQTPAPATRSHTVAQGETLWKIAELYYKNGNRYKDIVSANNLPNDGIGITPGQVLIIP